jgi:tRNA (cytosine38-C5)-methyltransferase
VYAKASSTRHLVISNLKLFGYNTFECLLTPLQFDIPNSRLRYYLLAKVAPLAFPCPMQDKVWTHIPGHGEPWTDPRTNSCIEPSSVRNLRCYIDDTPSDVYEVPDKVLSKWGRLFDIVTPSSRRTCCFTRGYTQLVEKSGSILQMNEELDVRLRHQYHPDLTNLFCRPPSRSTPSFLHKLHVLVPFRFSTRSD